MLLFEYEHLFFVKKKVQLFFLQRFQPHLTVFLCRWCLLCNGDTLAQLSHVTYVWDFGHMIVACQIRGESSLC